VHAPAVAESNLATTYFVYFGTASGPHPATMVVYRNASGNETNASRAEAHAVRLFNPSNSARHSAGQTLQGHNQG